MLSAPDPLETAAAINAAVDHWAPQLHVGSAAGIHPRAVLKAIADVETNYGARGLATLHENAYHYGGRYYRDSPDLQRLSIPWGCLAHSSFGPWQILFIAAYEMGFRGDPVELRQPSVCAPYVVRLLNIRTLDKVTDCTPEDVADAWNSGRARDTNVPQGYIDKFLVHYRRHAFGEGST